MKFSVVDLPSNKTFGFFFTFFFLILAGFFYTRSSLSWAYVFAIITVIFCLVTLVNAHLLLPLNMLWTRLGLLLGIIVSPIVLGIIFFVVFTPVAFIMRIYGRDELHLKIKIRSSHWIKRDGPIQKDSFTNQF